MKFKITVQIEVCIKWTLSVFNSKKPTQYVKYCLASVGGKEYIVKVYKKATRYTALKTIKELSTSDLTFDEIAKEMYQQGRVLPLAFHTVTVTLGDTLLEDHEKNTLVKLILEEYNH